MRPSPRPRPTLAALFAAPFGALLLALGCDSGHERAPVAEHVAERLDPARGAESVDPDPVTEANLYDKERYWPYRVAILDRMERGEGEMPIQAGRVGVLIRVEASGNPRIDFGAYGNYEIPVARTDVVERANRIRVGEAQKDAPNFTHAIRSRMLTPREGHPVAMPRAWADPRPGFLCVFIDPEHEAFEAVARALAPLQDRNGVGTILFPQGDSADQAVLDQLNALEWDAPFLADFLSEPYTRTVLPEGPEMPYLLLHTAEGRVLYSGPLDLPSIAAVEALLDDRFDPKAPVAQRREG